QHALSIQPPTPTPPLFPYTTLFRSDIAAQHRIAGDADIRDQQQLADGHDDLVRHVINGAELVHCREELFHQDSPFYQNMRGGMFGPPRPRYFDAGSCQAMSTSC